MRQNSASVAGVPPGFAVPNSPSLVHLETVRGLLGGTAVDSTRMPWWWPSCSQWSGSPKDGQTNKGEGGVDDKVAVEIVARCAWREDGGGLLWPIATIM